MNKKFIIVALVAILVIGGFLYYKKEPSIRIQPVVSDNQNTELNEVTYEGFEDAPAAVLSNIQVTVNKDNATDRRIGPGIYIQEVRLLSYQKVTWDNDCLADAPAPGTDCAAGTYPGYLVRLNIDGDLQEWRFTEDGTYGSIGAGLSPEFF